MLCVHIIHDSTSFCSLTTASSLGFLKVRQGGGSGPTPSLLRSFMRMFLLCAFVNIGISCSLRHADAYRGVVVCTLSVCCCTSRQHSIGHGGRRRGLRSHKQSLPLSRRPPTLGTLSNMDDDLGDLSELMGEDYKHGGAEDEGDPNVKPKVC